MATRDIPEILYHYCSTDTFLKIIESKCLWLSDLSKSNDSLEGKVAIDRIVEILQSTYNHSVEECEFVRQEYEQIAQRITCVGIAFSGRKDRLSQWRGYADDGRGIAIGFSGQWLLKTGHLRPVYYKKSEQKELISPHMSLISKNLSTNDRADIRAHLLTVGKEILYQFKDHFFHEEKEWRIRQHVSLTENEIRILYRSTGGKIVPYIELPLFCEDLESIQPIKEIWLGPKNTIPDDIIRGLLADNGFSDVKIKRSKGSYQ